MRQPGLLQDERNGAHQATSAIAVSGSPCAADSSGLMAVKITDRNALHDFEALSQ